MRLPDHIDRPVGWEEGNLCVFRELATGWGEGSLPGDLWIVDDSRPEIEIDGDRTKMQECLNVA